MNTEMLLPAAAECLLKGSLLVLVAATFCALRPALSASRRHVIWLCVLAGLAVLPLSHLSSPRWHLSGSLTPAISLAKGPLPIPVAASDSASRNEAVPVHSPRWAWPKPWQMLLGAWAMGVFAVLGYRLLGSWQIARLGRRSTALHDPGWCEIAEDAAAETGLRGRFEIRLSSLASVPCMWGLWRPVVLLPSTAAGWSAAQLRAVLRHEFAHAARRDYLTRWFATIVCALHWPNPLAWFAASRLQAAQEQACDDRVLGAGTPADEYAALLLDTARAAAGHPLRAAVAMARPCTLEGRVLAVVDPACDRRSASRGFSLVTALCLLLLIGASTLAQVATTPAATDHVKVEVKMIEFSAEAFAALPPSARPADPSKQGGTRVFDPAENTAFMEALSDREGVFLLSAPTVTTRSGQQVRIDTGSELRYPAEWEKAGASWKPTKFETRRLGISFEATPTVKPDGIIELQNESGRVRLLGWKDLDTAQEVDASTYPESPEGRRALPVFSERKLPSTITLRAGQTAACWMLPAAQPAGAVDVHQDRRPLLVLVTATLIKAAAGDAKEPPLPAPAGAEKKAAAIIIPRLNFREATLAESIDFLRAKSRELTPDHAGVNFVNQSGPAGGQAKITLDLTNVPLFEAARYVASLAGVELTTTPDALLFGGEPPKPPAAPAAPSAALARAQRIVIAKLEFNQANVEESLEYLRQKALALDAEKKGVNIVLKPGKATADVRLTLSLTNVPLSEVLRYVASLAGLELRAEPEALVLAEPAVSGPASPAPSAKVPAAASRQ